MEFYESNVRSEWGDDLEGVCGWFSNFEDDGTLLCLRNYVEEENNDHFGKVWYSGHPKCPFYNSRVEVSYKYFYPVSMSAKPAESRKFEAAKVRTEWDDSLASKKGWFSDYECSPKECLLSYVAKGRCSAMYATAGRGSDTFPFEKTDSHINYRYFYPDDSAEAEPESSSTEPVSSKFPKVVSFTCDAGYTWWGCVVPGDGWKSTIGIFDSVVHGADSARYWLVNRNTGKLVNLASRMKPWTFCLDEVKKLPAKETRKILRKVVLANADVLKEAKQ